MDLFGTRKGKPKNNEPAESGSFLRLLEITQEIHGTLDVDRALEIILDGALELTRMQRGFVMLNTDEDVLTYRMGRNHYRKMLNKEDFEVSNTVIQNALEQKQLYFFDNLTSGPTTSAARLQITCGLCVPLFASRAVSGTGRDRKVIGALYADSKGLVSFKKQEREIANALAVHAGLALENAFLFELAVRDSLTKLYVRRYFDSLANMEWKRTLRHSHSVSVLMLDLDHFKEVNDTAGHDAGDRVLTATADVLRNCARAEDVIARFGGDEFVMLLPETDRAGAEKVAKRILEGIPKNIPLKSRPLTISIGVSSYPKVDVFSIEELVRLADASLLRAKQEGRNRII